MSSKKKRKLSEAEWCLEFYKQPQSKHLFKKKQKKNRLSTVKEGKQQHWREVRDSTSVTWQKKITFIVSIFIQFNIIKHLLHETTSPFVP